MRVKEDEAEDFNYHIFILFQRRKDAKSPFGNCIESH
jgi:hypothetical protein